MTEYIPQSPSELFKYIPTREGTIMAEGTTSYKIDHIDYSNGVQVYVEGAEYPKKGFPTPEAIWSINLVKRTFIESIKLVSLPQFWSTLICILIFPKKKFLNKLIKSFNRLSFGALKPYILKPQFTTPIAKELESMVSSFLVDIGVEPLEASQCAEVFSHCIEYDTAYRYRLQDILSETSKQALYSNPRKEIKRIVYILSERELTPSVAPKFKKLAYILNTLLLSPKIKRAFKNAVDNSYFSRLQYDDADRYWCMLREDYLFMGKTFKQRTDLLKLRKYKIPQSYAIEA